MKFINNGTEAIKVRAEGNEKLPPVFKTVKPGETICAESDDYIKGYKKKGLVAVKEVEKQKDEFIDKSKDKEPEEKPRDKPKEKSKDKPKDEKKEPVTPTPKTGKSSGKDKKK